ncbi:T9SS type A sorting domain-containing protein [Brumimicrobium glaciale]|uniref:T9SS type A sorting domain-containing protein n=1 Tax=Brumimicrobium glaciale TaxID=200475 RepID=A0A4Q4KN77_9FLAO|nr:T9SS type A sorting domain-containing protein [Brumimicrobium glaciale]RYM34835.1 T9SS type A sorting domain-containing protein [Brumimicrobium glaciale]
MKKILLSFGLLLSAAVSAQDCDGLFISEYVEGWSNNKAIEIYNPTGSPINLNDYMLVRYSNGATFVGPESGVQLNGTIGAYDVYVAVIDKRDENGIGQEAPVWDSLQVRADGFYSPEYNVSKAMYFNGNDAMVLAKGTLSDIANSQLIDVFGKIGEDPDVGDPYNGWTDTSPFYGVGTVLTVDHSLIRKPGVKKGVTAVTITEFNALAKWDSIPAVLPMLDANGDPILDGAGNPRIEGNWATLGNHDCECNALSVNDEVAIKLSIYPNPSSNGVFNFATESNIVNVEVYSVVGQKVCSQENKTGIQSFTIGNQPGVYLVNLKTSNGVVTSRRVIVK